MVFLWNKNGKTYAQTRYDCIEYTAVAIGYDVGETRYGCIEMEYGTMKTGYDATGAYDNVKIEYGYTVSTKLIQSYNI